MKRFVLWFICIVLGLVIARPVCAFYRYTFRYDALTTTVNGHSYPQDSFSFITPVILNLSTFGQDWSVPSGADINGFQPTTFGVNGYGGSGTGAYLSFSSNYGSSSTAGEIENLAFRAYNPVSPGTYPAVPNSAGRGIYLGGGSTSWYYTSGSLTIESVYSVPSDFNNDGKPDILWRNTSTGVNAVWHMNGGTITGTDYLPAVADRNWTVAGTGDFNGDGRPDILWRNTSSGINAIWYMNGVAISSTALIPTVSDQNWKIVGVGDFNGDGRPDILWRNTSSGINAIWYMNGVAISSTALIPTVSDQNWKIIGVGDFDGAGRPDILWRNTSTGVNALWHMIGGTITGADYLPAVPDLNWTAAGTGDFDSDGRPDILWRNSSSGINAIWYMNGVAISSTALIPTVSDQNWKIPGGQDNR